MIILRCNFKITTATTRLKHLKADDTDTDDSDDDYNVAPYKVIRASYW